MSKFLVWVKFYMTVDAEDEDEAKGSVLDAIDDIDGVQEVSIPYVVNMGEDEDNG